MSVDAVYYEGDELLCINCESDNIDFPFNHGPVNFRGQKMDHSTFWCRNCRNSWEAYHPLDDEE